MNVADRGNGWQSVEQLYTTYRPFLFSLAYRMLGSVSDAEDAVQEVFATIREECFQNVTNPKAYLGKLGAQAERLYPHHPNGEEELVQKWVLALVSGNVEAIIGLIFVSCKLCNTSG